MKGVIFRQSLMAYLKSRVKLILLFVVFAAIFTAVFVLYDVRYDAALYAAALCAAIGTIVMLVDFAKFYNIYRSLLEAADRIGFSAENLPTPRNAVEKQYRELLKLLFENQKRILDETEADKRYLSDYYAMWIHQVKVPIAAMHLLMEGEEKNSPLKLELFKIEQYVEMALSYVRLKSDATDYVIREYRLENIIRQAVRKYAPLFIAKKIALDIAPVDATVITDEKWLQFVIEQILSNSLKYTKKGKISIYVESPKTLVIQDTGVGVAPEDIRRIGEKGFTGYNGRLDKKSTGLGLYLCREILERLSCSFEISSELGQGTKVAIDLNRPGMMTE